MPTYEYACKACGERLEVVQSFSDAPLTECPACGGDLRKVFSPVGIAFKGSGFYKTDSRSGSKKSASSTTSSSSDSAKSDSSSTKSDSGSSSTSSSSDSSGSKASTSTSGTAAAS
jgi:putative FmdB family regulatory protein